MGYLPGDVVFCKFPLREDPTQWTTRPALVMSVIDGGKAYKLAQITSTDRSGQLPGIFVEFTSKVGRAMRLRMDSFINLSNIRQVDATGIERYLGSCPIMDQIVAVCSKHKITY